MLEFARIWRDKPKIVFSSTLTEVAPGCRPVRSDVGEELTRLRREFKGELSVGGPTLAAQFIACGLVDEYRLVIHPVMLGGGTPYFPRLRRLANLRLLERHEFGSGVVYLSYVPV
jgi:dihydrofolate reductase